MTRREHNTPDTPITDPHEVLLKLSNVNYRTDAALLTPPRNKPITIERSYSGGPYGMEIVARDVWYVTPLCVQALEEHHWLDNGTEHWGYTDKRERRISDLGERALRDLAIAVDKFFLWLTK